MRQLGTLPDPRSAHALAEYLRTESIETRVEEAPEGAIVWVFDEDRVARAREVLQEFLENPADERFKEAATRAVSRREKRLEPPPVPRPPAPRGEWGSAPQLQLTVSLIALSGLVTLLFATGGEPKRFISHSLFITYLEPEGEGFRYQPGLPELREGELLHKQLWRLVTPIFIHFGLFHLLFNMMWLWALGRPLERLLGPLWLGLLILLIAVPSNLCQYLFSEVSLRGLRVVVIDSNPVFGGMSGVVFGLFGYVWMRATYEPASGLMMTRQTVLLMIAWLFICMTGIVGPIANTAHVIGLFAGMIAGYVHAWWNGFGARDTGAE